MSIRCYVVCWDSVLNNCIDIENNLESSNINYFILNSSSQAGLNKNWLDIGNIWYYNQFHYALKDFCQSNDSLFCFIAGDLEHEDFSYIVNKSEKIMSENKSIGIYAPYFTHEAWPLEVTALGNFNDELIISTQTDGIFTVINRDIAEIMLEVFNNISHIINDNEMSSGWGVDYIYNITSTHLGYLICRDKSITVTHPHGSSYNHDKASKEMQIFLDSAIETLVNMGISKEFIYEKFKLINDRASGINVPIENFYQNLKTWNYQIISINEDRAKNKDAINEILSNHNNLYLYSIYAADDDIRNKFFKDNPEFKISWGGFKLGELGNFASHFLVWKYLINSDMNEILVFEDDTDISEDFIEKINIYYSTLPKDWDIFSIFVHHNQYDRFTESNESTVVKAYQDWSTLCYLVSKSGAQKLYDYVVKNGMDYPTDWFIFRHAENNNFNVYTLNPNTVPPVKIDESYDSLVQKEDYL